MTTHSNEFIGGVPAFIFDSDSSETKSDVVVGKISDSRLYYEVSLRHIFIGDERLPKFYFSATLNQSGLVQFGIQTKGYKGTQRHPDLFASKLAQYAVETFRSRPPDVRGIQAIWYIGLGAVLGDNSEEYLKNIGNGLAPKEAALQTWEGRLAQTLEFPEVEGKVKVVRLPFATTPERVEVKFVQK